MDVATITGLATGVSTLVNLIKDLRGTEPNPTFDQMTEQVIGLQSLILSVQSEAFALQTENAELRAQLAKIRDWTAEKDKYEMKAIQGRAYVYALKPDMEGKEPPHWLCSACFEANRKSLYSFETYFRRDAVWKCSHCESRLSIRRDATPAKPS